MPQNRQLHSLKAAVNTTTQFARQSRFTANQATGLKLTKLTKLLPSLCNQHILPLQSNRVPTPGSCISPPMLASIPVCGIFTVLNSVANRRDIFSAASVCFMLFAVGVIGRTEGSPGRSWQATWPARTAYNNSRAVPHAWKVREYR